MQLPLMLHEISGRNGHRIITKSCMSVEAVANNRNCLSVMNTGHDGGRNDREVVGQRRDLFTLP